MIIYKITYKILAEHHSLKLKLQLLISGFHDEKFVDKQHVFEHFLKKSNVLAFSPSTEPNDLKK